MSQKFVIKESRNEKNEIKFVSPDIAVCHKCLGDIQKEAAVIDMLLLKEGKIMCIAVPAQVLDVDSCNGRIDIMGVESKINIQLIEELKAGDYILVHQVET